MFGNLWDPAEIAKALDRPAAYQTPIPRPGDRVLFRMEPFALLTDAQVVAVQDADDYTDHYLWHVRRDDEGGALLDELGNRQLTPAPDPWPVLTLATDWGRLTTREGRVRGANGWWPVDWRYRWYPVPGGSRFARDVDNERRAA